MLHALANYAAKYKIPALPGFKEKTAKWIVVLTEGGKLIDLVEDSRLFTLAPDLTQGELIAGGVTRSHFLIDSASTVLAYDAKDKEVEKHQFFIQLLEEAAVAEPTLQIIANALKEPTLLEEMQNKLQNKKGRKTEAVTFRVDDLYPLELDTWHNWWRQFRLSIRPPTKQEREMICLLSGEKAVPLATHGKLGGLTGVGGQSSGATLIGFDKESFASFGLGQSQNAACSEEATVIYRNALQQLINTAPRPLGGVMFLNWYKEPIPPEDDFFGLDDSENPEAEEAGALAKAEALLKAIDEGKRPDLLHNRYYILQISGTGGRIMVRDWQEGDYQDLVQNFKQWFHDLSLVTPTGKGLATDFKLSAALTRLVTFRPNDRKIFQRIAEELPALMPSLWHSIINKTPLPDTVASKSLAHIRSRIHHDDSSTIDNLDRIACALLKAWLIRKKSSQGGKIMEPKLNPQHPSPAYHAGRLMAVLGALQNRALGDVGAGVIQRYYAAASATPALVLGRLIRGAQYHLDKLDKGPKIWYEKLIGEVVVQLGDGLPTTLTLEEQSLFALGYYQQRAAIYSGSKREQAIITDEINETEED